MRPAPIASPQGMLEIPTRLRLQCFHERNPHLLYQHAWIDTMRLSQAGKVTGQAFTFSGSHANWCWRVERTAFWQGDGCQLPPGKLRKLCVTHRFPPLS